jgi:hypothetical protein
MQVMDILGAGSTHRHSSGDQEEIICTSCVLWGLKVVEAKPQATLPLIHFRTLLRKSQKSSEPNQRLRRKPFQILLLIFMLDSL